jgi:hypothetical protein
MTEEIFSRPYRDYPDLCTLTQVCVLGHAQPSLRDCKFQFARGSPPCS